MRKTILVVEDESRMRRVFRDVLTDVGYDVVEAPNADEANEMVKNRKIDLVLLDIRMPEVHGGILCDVLRLFHKKTRVIVSSVYPIERQKRIIRDAAEYFDKSQGVRVLLSKVMGVLGSAS